MNRRNLLLGAVAATVAPAALAWRFGGPVSWALTETFTETEKKIFVLADPNAEWTSAGGMTEDEWQTFLSMIDRGLLVPHPDCTERWQSVDSGDRWMASSFIRSPKANALLGLS